MVRCCTQFSRPPLLLIEHLEDLKSNGKYLIGELLSIITHTTNGYRKKLHFSPTDVRAKRQKDHREFLKQKYSELQQSGDYEELLNEAFEQIDSYDSTIEALKEEHQQIVDSFEMEKMELEDKNESFIEEIRSNKYTISELKRQLGSASTGEQPLDAELIQILSEALSHDPSPEQCLKLVEAIYPSRIVVLDSALASARDSGRPRKLSATPDHTGKVLPLCPIPNSASQSAPPFKSVTLRTSVCAESPA